MMASMSAGVPERVWAKAQQLGIHPACAASDEPCQTCDQNLMLAFEFYYGDNHSMDEVISAIVHDIASEHEKGI